MMQATLNFEFLLPLIDVVVGIVPPSSMQYTVGLAATPWLRLDTVHNRCVVAGSLSVRGWWAPLATALVSERSPPPTVTHPPSP